MLVIVEFLWISAVLSLSIWCNLKRACWVLVVGFDCRWLLPCWWGFVVVSAACLLDALLSFVADVALLFVCLVCCGYVTSWLV